MLIKYRLGELAKDLEKANKEILPFFGERKKDKRHTTILSEDDLNLFFNNLTKEYNVENFDALFMKNGEAKVDMPKKEESKEKKAETKAVKPLKKTAPKPSAKPAAKPAPKQKAADQTYKPRTKERVRRVVDTSATVVNVDRFNEKYEKIAQRAGVDTGGKDSSQTRRQKFNQRSRQRRQAPGRRQKQETEAQRLERIHLEKARKAQLKVSIPDEISVGELSNRLKVAAPTVIKALMGLGVMASISDVIDFDTASLIADEMGALVEKEVRVTIEERLNIDELSEQQIDEKDLEERPPVVVVMGHVDHGKTSLLDSIRKTNVIEGEAGGITQHIGAYMVKTGEKLITFLDTPGHEAFTSMRARGASITDIAILVVAADDGVMPQTIEAINHAKAADVTIIVAINKIDKQDANVERVKQELTEYGIVPEEWGGETICVPVSAATGEGIDSLLEMIMLVAEVMELKASPDRQARGTVVEAKLDKGRGPVATVLIQNGTLNQGDTIIAGTAIGRVRVMTDDRGRQIDSAGPSTPVEITGLTEVPLAGDSFNAVEDEKLARELVDQRRAIEQEEIWGSGVKVTLDNLFSQIAEGELKELAIIVKADVQGTSEAVKQSLEKLSNEEVKVKVIHSGVGGINSSDVMLAEASGAIIVGFNVRPDSIAIADSEQKGVEMKMYRVIYDAIEDIEAAIKGMKAPKIREKDLGRIEVREIYKISSVGTVAGCYVLSGRVTRDSMIRVVRDGIIIYDDKLSTLRRFKDDVKEVREGFECGIVLEKFADIKQGDIFESYVMEEYRD
ncbi:MAG: translation initiation factor IF-2 [Ruminococcaceae bacterium]|nr:translation initiation factor IF-2 [Oscillospiraceae bacterium]